MAADDVLHKFTGCRRYGDKMVVFSKVFVTFLEYRSNISHLVFVQSSG